MGSSLLARRAGNVPATNDIATITKIMPIIGRAGKENKLSPSKSLNKVSEAILLPMRPTIFATPKATSAPQKPIKMASKLNKAKIFNFLMPKAFISPISLVRSATAIIKVLIIPKVAATRAIPAKILRKVVMALIILVMMPN